ncbi:protein CNPPD1 [Thrips palmi]|uniref:Protein CNPPD1 n=1 Tax=Thrips palmi TaxID=161013 RepID=A0A6P8ZNK3_THRPL|nr:protein CNPPD1 [Thrips palmi]
MGCAEFCRKRRRSQFTSMGDHNKFSSRIKKSLYYGQLPSSDRLSLPVTELATEIFSAAQRNHSLQRLELQEASDVSRSACVSPCSLVLAMLYLERLQTSRPSYLRETSPSELYLVSLMVATKFLQDDGEEDGVINEEWATSAGITTSQLNQLERDFLDAIEWEVYVSEETFWTRLRGLERDVALNEGVRRGWFSYADLDCLLEKVDLASLAHSVLTVSAVCLTSYTASVLTLIASTLLVSHLQPLIHGLSGLSQTSLNSSTMPIQADQVPSDSTMDPSFSPPNYQSPLDVLTTSFILASISSCQGRLANDSTNCLDDSKPSGDTLRHALLGNFEELSMQDNVEPNFKFSSWSDPGSISWFKWIKDLKRWFRTPIVESFDTPPDWAASLSYRIDRGSSQSRLIPLQVY